MENPMKQLTLQNQERAAQALESPETCFLLNDGREIPVLGFGTWQNEGEDCVRSVQTAIEAGYRHIDTAKIYGNEVEVGRALHASSVSREEIWLTTKLWNDVRGYDETRAAIDASLKALDVDYIDLYLIHWPNPKAFRDSWASQNLASWRAMEDAVAAGKLRSIGVSNFRPHHLEALLPEVNVRPAVNQVRICPGDVPRETIAFCEAEGILLEGYSPLGRGELLDHETLVEIAVKKGQSVAQICLRWQLQHAWLPLPKSKTGDRIRENLDIWSFDLSPEEMAQIDALEGIAGYAHDPDATDF